MNANFRFASISEGASEEPAAGMNYNIVSMTLKMIFDLWKLHVGKWKNFLILQSDINSKINSFVKIMLPLYMPLSNTISNISDSFL
jgi:hypothetical protein